MVVAAAHRWFVLAGGVGWQGACYSFFHPPTHTHVHQFTDCADCTSAAVCCCVCMSVPAAASASLFKAFSSAPAVQPSAAAVPMAAVPMAAVPLAAVERPSLPFKAPFYGFAARFMQQ